MRLGWALERVGWGKEVQIYIGATTVSPNFTVSVGQALGKEAQGPAELVAKQSEGAQHGEVSL